MLTASYHLGGQNQFFLKYQMDLEGHPLLGFCLSLRSICNFLTSKKKKKSNEKLIEYVQVYIFLVKENIPKILILTRFSYIPEPNNMVPLQFINFNSHHFLSTTSPIHPYIQDLYTMNRHRKSIFITLEENPREKQKPTTNKIDYNNAQNNHVVKTSGIVGE